MSQFSSGGEIAGGSSSQATIPVGIPAVNISDLDRPAVSFLASGITGIDGDAIATWTATVGNTNTLTAVTPGTNNFTSPILKIVDGKKVLRFAGTTKLRSNSTFGTTLAALMNNTTPTDNFSITCVYRTSQGIADVSKEIHCMQGDNRYKFLIQNGTGLIGGNQPRYVKQTGTGGITAPKKLRMNRESWQVVTWQVVVGTADDATARTVNCYYDGDLDGSVTFTLAQWLDSNYGMGTAVDFFCNFVGNGTSTPHFQGDVLQLDLHTTALIVTQMCTYQKRLMGKYGFYLESRVSLNSSRPLIIGVIGDSNSQTNQNNGGSAPNITYAERIVTALTTELGIAPVLHDGAIAGRASRQYALALQGGNGSDVIAGYSAMLLGPGFKSPDICFLQHGTNDIVQGMTDAETRNCLAGIVDNIMAHVPVVIVNYIPWYNTLAVASNISETNRINRAIRDVVLAKQSQYPNRVFFGATDCMQSITSVEEMAFYYTRPGITDVIHYGQTFIDQIMAPCLTDIVRQIIRLKGWI